MSGNSDNYILNANISFAYRVLKDPYLYEIDDIEYCARLLKRKGKGELADHLLALVEKRKRGGNNGSLQ